MNKIKSINLYLVAFFAILTKCLILTMGYPEVVAMAAILTKLGFDAYIVIAADKADKATLEGRLKKAEDRLTQIDNSIKLINVNKR